MVEHLTGPDGPNARAFLEALKGTANVTRAAELADISRTWLYDMRATHPDFAKAWDAAMELGLDALEDECMRRAKEGTRKYVTSMGKVVMDPEDVSKPLVEHVYSDTLAQFILKGRRPERYKDRTETSGSVALTISSDDANL